MLDHERFADVYGIIFRRADLEGCRAMCRKIRDGYLVFVAQYLEGKELERSIDHELLHIFLGHLDNFAEKDEETKEQEVQLIMKQMGWK